MQEGLMEIYVDHQDGFSEILMPARSELCDYFLALDISLPKGYCAEVNLQAIDWMAEIADSLDYGYVITIDYGGESADLYRADRCQGTLLCYDKHVISDCYYEHIGAKDITAHVNFSALRHWGTLNGLEETGYTDQGSFLGALGFREQLLKRLESERDVLLAARKANWLTHKLLVEMGRKFKVLVQQKGLGVGGLKSLSHCLLYAHSAK
jgi:SAM-dependent MidA family methyltransferase